MNHLLFLGSKLSFHRHPRILYTACGIYRSFRMLQGVEDILDDEWKMVLPATRFPSRQEE